MRPVMMVWLLEVKGRAEIRPAICYWREMLERGAVKRRDRMSKEEDGDLC